MAYQYLYQAIKNVPGLSGSGFTKQKSLYERLGGPMGSYRGTTQQNMWLLNQINSGNTGGNPTPTQSAPTQPTATSNSLAQQYADMAGAGAVKGGPVFGEVMPFFKAWERFLPSVEQEAASQINPYIQRDLRQNLGQMNLQLAQTGGGRFGRALGGQGVLEAEAERQRKSQTQDWVNSRQQGFKSLFYDPAEEAYNRALELGKTPNMPNIPTWQQFISGNMSPMGGAPTQVGVTRNTTMNPALIRNSREGYSNPLQGFLSGANTLPTGGTYRPL